MLIAAPIVIVSFIAPSFFVGRQDRKARERRGGS